MLQRLFRSTGMAVLLAAASAFVVPSVQAQADPMAHIAASEATLSNFLRDPDMSWLQQNFGRAKAVIMSPEIVKAGFIFGGSGGRALVVARDPKSGKWVGPGVLRAGDGQRRFPGRHLGVGRRHAGDDRQGIQLVAVGVVQDGR